MADSKRVQVGDTLRVLVNDPWRAALSIGDLVTVESLPDADGEFCVKAGGLKWSFRSNHPEYFEIAFTAEGEEEMTTEDPTDYPGQQVLPTDNNPKAARALLDGKAPMDLIPYRPLAAVARVLGGGAVKYGKRNWREEPISATTYVGAIARHALLEWAEGVDEDADSGEHPLAHVIASCLLVMDAEQNGTLIDDRGESEVIGR